MQIVRCDASQAAAWNAFVESSANASFYHRAEWRDINERCFGHRTAYLAALEGSQIVGVFPLVRLKSVLFGNLACSMPFVNYGGPAGDSDEIEQRLLDEASLVADEWGVEYLEIRSLRHLGDRFPCSEHKVSMTIELDPDPEVVLNRFKREHRHEIRRAAKRGYVPKFGPDLLDDFYEVLAESWRELGTPIFTPHYLRAVLKAFPRESVVCVVYDQEGRPAAGAFYAFHNGIVEGMWLGMRAESRQQLVGYVLYWELIKNACETGAKSFHLGRSTKDSGAEVFKKKWNADAMQLYWHYVLRTRKEIPSLNPSNPKYRLAVRTWQNLPVSLTKVLGPLIAKHIP